MEKPDTFILGLHGQAHTLSIQLADEKAHADPAVKDFYRDVATEISREVVAGKPVIVIFRSPLGVQLDRAASR